MKAIAALFVFALDIPTVIFRGFVLSRLWHWFVVPLGVIEIGVAMAIGIALLVSLMARDPLSVNSDDEKSFIEKRISRCIDVNILTLLAWGIGALTACFL